MQEKQPLEIKYVSPSELVPYLKNPRINDHAVDPVKKSIEHFGFLNPIIARRFDNMIIAGHTRIKAALKAGIKQVPVIFVDLSENDAKLYNLTDNKLGEFAIWDIPGLDSILDELRVLDIDVSLAGFSSNRQELEQDIEWDGMPEFKNEEIERNAFICIVRFLNEDDIIDFQKKIGCKLTHYGKTYSTYFPPQNFNQVGKGLEFSDES